MEATYENLNPELFKTSNKNQYELFKILLYSFQEKFNGELLGLI